MKYIVYSALDASQRRALFQRPAQNTAEQRAVTEQVAQIEAQLLGDNLQIKNEALRRLCLRLDGAEPLALGPDLWRRAWAGLDGALQAALERALANIARFHESQLPRRREAVIETESGVCCHREFRAIEAVGLYVPGGSAPLFSTMLMLGVPAIIAGCQKIIFCSPPSAQPCEPGAYAAQEMLACMDLLRRFAEKFTQEETAKQAENTKTAAPPKAVPSLQYFQIGGAQAIFAMAYGALEGADTPIPQVAKIFGPGNAYVTEAKLRASRYVSIDMPAGPSEVLVIADREQNPAFLAADLLSQAEHGPGSQVLLLSPSAALLREVEAEVERQREALPRMESIRAALKESCLIETQDIAEALAFSNAYAPEHLLLALRDSEARLPQIVNAGSVFCGPLAAESFGDYASGTNHTLPTAGFARSCSGLGVQSFGRWMSVQSVSPKGLAALGPTVELLAEREQMQAHKNAITLRLLKREPEAPGNTF